MSQFKSRLGRGLEALIPQDVIGDKVNRVEKIPVSLIKANPYQPRTRFKDESLQSLSKSIKQHGLQQPILLRKKEGYYELIAGERRLRASVMAGVSEISSIVKNLSDRDSMKIALIENIQREDLSSIDVAKGYLRLQDEFDYKQQDIANIFATSRSAVANSLRLLKLPKAIQELLHTKQLSEGHAKALLSLKSSSEQLSMAEQILKEGLTVRDVEKSTKNNKPVQKAKPSQWQHMQDELSQKFCVDVSIKNKRNSLRKGKIEIEFESEQELTRLFTVLSR